MRSLIKSNCPRCPECGKTFPETDAEREVVASFHGSIENHFCHKQIKTRTKVFKNKTRQPFISIVSGGGANGTGKKK